MKELVQESVATIPISAVKVWTLVKLQAHGKLDYFMS